MCMCVASRFVFLPAVLMLNTEPPCVCHFCTYSTRSMHMRNVMVQGFRIIQTQKNYKRFTFISQSRPLSCGDRNRGEPELMRQADGLYIRRQWLKSFGQSIKRRAAVASNLTSRTHDHHLGKEHSFMLRRAHEECIQITLLSTHSCHQFTLPWTLR